MEKKIKASEEKDKLFEEILRSSDPGAFREFVGRGVEKVLQESLEEEVREFLGPGWYEHREKVRSEEKEPIMFGRSQGDIACDGSKQ